jgi:hypothetical protein
MNLGQNTTMTPQPKQNAVRSTKYRRWVASQPCIHCGLEGSSQCAHRDEGKGMHCKQDDRQTYPACCNAIGRVGCHDLIGTSRVYGKAERRALEIEYVGRTQANAIASGAFDAGFFKD